MVDLWVYRDLAVADVEFELEGARPEVRAVTLVKVEDGSWLTREF